MNVVTITTILLPAGACEEPIGFHSSSEDYSSAAERVSAAKNLVLRGRAPCLGPPRESLNLEARPAHSCLSLLAGGALYHRRRDSFRHPSCAAALYSWHRRGHGRNSDPGRRSSLRSRDDTGRGRQRVQMRLHDWRLRHHWGNVSQLGTVGFRDMPVASAVFVDIPRRTVFLNGRRSLADSELDDDIDADLPEVMRYFHSEL
jgi:hypothetical protein